MKKIILFLNVCLVLTLFSNCSESYVEIPDANFKSYLLENFDKNKDGKISFSEAKAVKKIDCSGKQIKDLKGIEYFENLESLDCSYNDLADIEIDKNNKIEKLVCNGNNEKFQIYINFNSPLKNKNLNKPQEGEIPQEITQPLDEEKVSYDKNRSDVFIRF